MRDANFKRAFPVQFTMHSGGLGGYDGMGLRDYFAAAALQGILAGNFANTVPHDHIGAGIDAAEFAYMYADAMMRERDKS